MQKLHSQMVKWAFGGLFLYFLILPEIFLVDQYISKGNVDMFRFCMTIIVFAKILILAISATVIIIKNQKHEKNILI